MNKNKPNKYAVEARKQICQLQQNRMDESFHINVATAQCMIDKIIQDAIDESLKEFEIARTHKIFDHHPEIHGYDYNG